ncbi:DUF2459 domain-containing protein [Croceibacterium aestuarii]|uniref:DUF2459 domain-containing protein n=1 Tax=Croceibacterium aestuarii TaxID=3064139 RepID=UPI00272EB0E8|nr:DUF2459 domain-containing protein [Croceibacterium sp. D39]
MAAPPLRRLIGRIARWTAIALAASAALFFLTVWIGSSIPRNPGWREPGEGVEIMVQSNGVHTALVVPLVAPERDWRPVFPAGDVALSGLPYTHLAISWGEREVFLNTPTWSDLSPVTVLRIVGIGGEGLLHVEHYVRPAPSEDLRPLRLTHGEYARLVAAIDRVVPQGQRVGHPGYGAQDVFYETGGHYTVRNTCNQWTSNTLAAAGVKTGWWTPMAGGVMKWVPHLER